MDGYIQYLSDKNITELQFPDLYEDRRDGKYSTLTGDDMTLKQLAILKNKIKKFNYNPKKQTITDVIYSNINKIVYVDKQYANLLQELRDEFGTFNDYVKGSVEDIFNEEKQKEKNERIARFKSIVEHNIYFIIRNRESILERIDEVFKLKNEKINEELKEKKRLYCQEYNEQNKAKRNEYNNTKISCECGFMTARKNLTRHKKTELHSNRLNALSNNVVI